MTLLQSRGRREADWIGVAKDRLKLAITYCGFLAIVCTCGESSAGA